MKKSLYVLLAIAFFIALLTGTVRHVLELKKIEGYRFSNTQTWDEELLPFQSEETKIVKGAYSKINIPQPPSNTSKQTKEDLRQLHEMISFRTNETLKEIEDEQKLANAYIGKHTFAELTSTTSYPHTSFFIKTSLFELSFLVIQFKNTFDRVRPSYLDPSLTTTIPVPNHPAYPSGHASQSYFIALLMSELDPEHREEYLESARHIAQHREIAGVHYPSDSEAGMSLATQYFNLLKETAWYAIYFEQAKREW